MHFNWNLVPRLQRRVRPRCLLVNPLPVSLEGQRLEVLDALLGVFLSSNKHLLTLLFHFFELELLLLDRLRHVVEPRIDLGILLP